MEEEDPEFRLKIVEFTKQLKESFSINIPYREVRQKLLIDFSILPDKKIFRFYLDKIAIEILGRDTAYREILIDENRLQREGEEPTYPLYPGLYPGRRN